MRYSKSLAFALTVVVLLVVSCRAKTASSQKITVADLEKLKWIEGTWRGSGDAEKPFFERYRFENGSTLAVDNFTDEKLTTIDDTTRFELKDGDFTNGGGGDGARWIATSVDYQSITFEPLAKAKNSFRWQRESDDSWTAIMTWPPADGKPSRQRVYKMERWPKK